MLVWAVVAFTLNRKSQGRSDHSLNEELILLLWLPIFGGGFCFVGDRVHPLRRRPRVLCMYGRRAWSGSQSTEDPFPPIIRNSFLDVDKKDRDSVNHVTYATLGFLNPYFGTKTMFQTGFS
jgi:hypothetical protein